MTNTTIRRWTPEEVARDEAEQAERARAYKATAEAYRAAHPLETRLKALAKRLTYLEEEYPDDHTLYRRYAITSEADLREGVNRLNCGTVSREPERDTVRAGKAG